MTISRVYPPGWSIGEKLTSAQMNAVDEALTYALDKRAGQTDTLASDVEVTGETTFEGDVSINALAEVRGTVRTLSGGRIEHADNDYPQLAVGHTGRTVIRRIEGGLSIGLTLNNTVPAGASGAEIDESHANIDRDFCRTIITVVSTTTPATDARALLFDLAPHLVNGATVTQVVVSVQGGSPHTGLPSLMPAIRVGRYTGSDNALHSSGSSVSDTSASVAAYEAAHSITATCDQNNVVDKSSGSYYLAVFNEGGTNGRVGLIVRSVTITQTIVDLRPG